MLTAVTEHVLAVSLPGAPYSRVAVADLLAGEAARELARYVRALVPAGPERGDLLDEQAAHARGIGWRAEAAEQSQVVALAVRKVSWRRIAEGFGVNVSTAHDRWAQAVGDFHRRYDEGMHRAAYGGPGPGEDDGPIPDRVQHLEQWVAAQRETSDRDPGPAAVADRIRPMTLNEESGFLDELRDILFDDHTPPPPELLLPITLRAAEIDEAISALLRDRYGRAFAESAESAARSRAYARELAAHSAPEIAALYADRLAAPHIPAHVPHARTA